MIRRIRAATIAIRAATAAWAAISSSPAVKNARTAPPASIAAV